MLRAVGRAGFRVPAACGAVLTAGAWCAFWWLAVPRHEICAMTLPAPAGCGSGRVPVAALWSVVILGLYGVVLLSCGRSAGRRWRAVAVSGLIIGVVGGYLSVLYA